MKNVIILIAITTAKMAAASIFKMDANVSKKELHPANATLILKVNAVMLIWIQQILRQIEFF